MTVPLSSASLRKLLVPILNAHFEPEVEIRTYRIEEDVNNLIVDYLYSGTHICLYPGRLREHGAVINPENLVVFDKFFFNIRFFGDIYSRSFGEKGFGAVESNVPGTISDLSHARKIAGLLRKNLILRGLGLPCELDKNLLDSAPGTIKSIVEFYLKRIGEIPMTAERRSKLIVGIRSSFSDYL